MLSNEISHIDKKLAISDNSSNQIQLLVAENSNLDFIIGGKNVNPETVQKEILNFVSNSEHEVDIVTIKDVHISTKNGFRVFSNQIELEGSYEMLVSLLYDLERNFNKSRILNAHIYSEMDFRAKTKRLILDIIFQNYEKEK